MPDDPQTLRTLVLQLLEALRGERAQREQVEHRLDLVLRKLYGRSSEKVYPHQLALFDSSPDETAAESPPVAEASEQPQPRGGHGRRPKPDHFRRVDVVHDFTDAEKATLAGIDQLVLIGEEGAEQYEWQPSSLYVVRHVQKKYTRQPQLVESGLGPRPEEHRHGPQAAAANSWRHRRTGPACADAGQSLRRSFAFSQASDGSERHRADLVQWHPILPFSVSGSVKWHCQE